MFFALLGARQLELLGLVFWIVIIYDCAKRERGARRLLWLLLVVFVPDIGSLIYFLVRVIKIRG
jgi:hypothetical protein